METVSAQLTLRELDCLQRQRLQSALHGRFPGQQADQSLPTSDAIYLPGG
jgi:hypothetical protein